MGILGDLFGKRAAPSLDTVTFEVSRYAHAGDRDGVRIWHLPEGGGVGLYFFPRTPDLPAALSSIGQLRDSLVARMGEKLRLVDYRVLPVDGVRSVWQVIRAPDGETLGMAYIGSLIIPFRDFSFVIKLQCFEKGMTGVREAILLDASLKNGTGSFQGGQFVPHGWSFDDEQFDAKFPDHPLSRVRREWGRIAPTIRIDPAIKNAARFALPQEGN